MDQPTTTIYTTAPSDYDYGWVEVLDENVATCSKGRKIYRKLAVPTDRVEFQRGRYASGLYFSGDQVEFDKLVEYKLVTVTQ